MEQSVWRKKERRRVNTQGENNNNRDCVFTTSDDDDDSTPRKKKKNIILVFDRENVYLFLRENFFLVFSSVFVGSICWNFVFAHEHTVYSIEFVVTFFLSEWRICVNRFTASMFNALIWMRFQWNYRCYVKVLIGHISCKQNKKNLNEKKNSFGRVQCTSNTHSVISCISH